MIEEKLEELKRKIKELKASRENYRQKLSILEQENRVLKAKIMEAERKIEEIISLIDREIGNV
ncbi:MAG: hypothetical protein J7L62_00900 [Candidatus Aminicenantes bacterium]|nr:hypothetical protein [Candidatus Aminicenantes bacterium]